MVIGGLVTKELGSRRIAARADAPDARAAEFERLVERRLDEAYRLATFILRDPSEAEDAVHDAALAAWRHRSELRDPARADAWFQRILVNGCRDRLRARGRRRVASVGLDLSRVDSARSPDVADRVVASRTIDDAVVRLEPDDRVLVALRYGLDLTVPAIATALGIREGTVKSRLHRALSRLRLDLEEVTP
jgi:RNA polymerase sigma-70 factor (ECF subfamily)